MFEGRRFALLVGSGQFDHPALAPLPPTAQDVADLGRLLRECGEFEVTICLDEIRAEIHRHIYDLFAGKSSSDTVLFYYTGHGLRDFDGRFYLSARDTDPMKPGRDGVWSGTVHDFLERCGASRKIFILDCCFSGALDNAANRRIGKSGREQPWVTLSDFDGDEGQGTFVLMPTEAGQLAPGEAAADGTSPFTSILLRALEGEAAPDDDQITTDQLAEFVSRTARAELNISPCYSTRQAHGRIALVHNPMSASAMLPDGLRQGIVSTLDLTRIGAAWALAHLAREDADKKKATAARRLLERRLAPEAEKVADVRQAILSALQSSYGIGDWRPEDTQLPDLRQDPEKFNLTGVWEGDDGGLYLIRNLGNEVFWCGFGPDRDGQPLFANVAYGRVEGIDNEPSLRLRWADVPAGTTNLWGDLVLDVRFSEEYGRVVELLAREKSGEFGGNAWTWIRHWGLTSLSEES
jgi:hypothetical protein